jgi:lipoprotein-releasing system ATP-binding protein
MVEASKKANSLFEILGVSNRQNHRPAELSGGEQQRVSIARSLINAPKIVFADEPSGNLDSMNANELHKLFFDLREQFKQTFVIVTHNELLADKADRKLVMQDGFLTSN